MIKSSFICQYIETIWIVPLMTSPKIKGLLKWIGLNLRGQLYHIQHVPVQCFYLSEHITFSNLMVQCFTNMKSQHDIWKHANTISTSDYFIVYSIYGTSILLLFMCTSRYTLTMQCMGANVFGTLECSYRGWGGVGVGVECVITKKCSVSFCIYYLTAWRQCYWSTWWPLWRIHITYQPGRYRWALLLQKLSVGESI